MQVLVPDFQYMRTDQINRAIDLIKESLGKPDLTDLQVCVHVLRSRSEENIIGIPPAWWWILASLHILPDLITNPWYEVCWWLYEKSRGKRELNTLWGAANCGKTEFFASVAITNMVVWIGETHVYVTSPWKTHGSDKIWDALRKRSRLWEKALPQWAQELNLKIKVRDDGIYIEDDGFNTSTAGFVSLDSAASIQGKKRNKREDGLHDDKKRGVMLLLSDEITENPAACSQLIEAESNYLSNPNYMGFVAFNPKPHKVQHPNALSLSMPVDVGLELLHKDSDFTWRTCRGLLIRLADANSPNRMAPEKPVFSFLINQDHINAAIQRGEASIAAMVEAWGWGESDNGSELTQQTCDRVKLQLSPTWVAPPQRCLFIDPAFGGRDAASYTCVEFGKAFINGDRVNVISGVEQQSFAVPRVWIPSEAEIEEFHKNVRDYRGSLPETLQSGVEASSSDYMTYRTLQICKRLNIPIGHTTFDASQRADVYLPMSRALGRMVWYYEGTRRLIDEEGKEWKRFPIVRNPTGEIKKWSDEVTRPISMIWRFAERVISREHVMGLSNLRRGLSEMRSRRWVTTRGTGREDVEGKAKLLSSPTFGEGLSMCIYFAARYLGALPQIFDNEPEVQTMTEDPLFLNIRSRRLNPAIWR